jgi:iron complex outermembrane receptor protein
MDVRGLDTYAPGFTDVGGPSFGRFQRAAPYFVIRGMIPGRSVDTLRQTVSIFVDGVPVSGGNIAGLPDIEQVEIVKGPQSAYFGRSSFGGAINLITREPGDQWGARVTTDFSSFGTNESMASIEGPLSESLAFRLGARHFRTDGQYSNPQGGDLGEQQTQSATLQLLWKPSESAKIGFFGTVWEDDDGPQSDAIFGGGWAPVNSYNCDMGLGRGAQNGICGALPGLRNAITYHDAAGINSPPIRDVLVNLQGVDSVLGPGFIDNLGLKRKAYEAHINAEWALWSGYTLNVNVGKNRNEYASVNDGILVPNPPYQFIDRSDVRNDDMSFEARITSPRERPLKWMFGANYLSVSAETSYPCYFFGPFQCAPVRDDEADTLGVFGSISYDFGSGLTLAAEARVQQDDVSSEVRNSAAASDKFNSFTPRLILSKAFSEDVNGYASFARGVKPGTFNLNLLSLTPAQQAQVIGQTNAALTVDEETIDMVELGLKGEFIDRRLRVLGSIYYGKWKDQQITKTGLYTIQGPNGPSFLSIGLAVPVGETELRGVELEAQMQLTDNVTGELIYNFADSTIKEYSCGNCQVYETGTDDVTGNELPLFPRQKATLALMYERGISADYRGFIRGEYVYRSKIYATETNLTWVGDAHRANLRLGVEKDDLSVELFARNVFNQDQYQSVAWAGTFLGSIATNDINQWVVGLADRRTFGIRVSAKIGGR